MIHIKTQTGYFLDVNDSKCLITMEILDNCGTFYEFVRKISFYEDPNYWGEYILEKPLIEYKHWIVEIGESVFNK